MVPLALGSDGGGSIRIPAACCGIAGLKPGPGVVPLAGSLDQHWLGLSAYGPLARSVDDLALMFRVLRGTDTRQPVAPPTSTLRIAVSTRATVIGARVDKQVRAAVESLGDKLAGAGHKVTQSDPPIPKDLPLRFMRRWLPGIAQDADSMVFDQLEPRTRSMARAGRWLQRRGWDQPVSAEPFARVMTEWFEHCDVLLTPTLCDTAVPVGKWRNRGWFRTAISAGHWVCTAPWNVAGLPAASVPAGLADNALPIGAQLVAAPGREELLLALMSQVEQLAPWPSPAP
jgi:amidase